MKTAARVLAALMVLSGCNRALAETSTNVPGRVTLELVDGSRSIGTLSITELPVLTAYAKLTISLKRVRCVVFDPKSETVSVEFVNNDKITGKLNVASLKIKTIFGEVKIDTKHVAKLTTGLAGKAPLRKLKKYDKVKTLSLRAQCLSNLHQFDLALSAYCYPPVNFYPDSVGELTSRNVSAELFVCPHAGEKPGKRSEAASWTDYIYIAGQSPSTPGGTPIMICPPENHGGEGGVVMDADHSVRWLPKKDIEKLISDTYKRAKKGELRIVVSDALRAGWGDKYKSVPEQKK